MSGRIAVFTHSSPQETSEAIEAVARTAAESGRELVATQSELKKHEGRGDLIEIVEEPASDVELCIAFGGDGTILRALRAYSGTGVPVFGVNYGTVGFLAAAERIDLQMALERAFSGQFEVVSLPGLSVGEGADRRVAFNDISVTRQPHRRVADLSYRLGGREVGHVRCDGLVAATPVGSTGYNLANGGPILAWGVEGYAVSFIAPHTLTARALVVAPDDVLHVHNLGDRDSVDVVADGMPVADLAPQSEIAIRFEDGLASLAQLEGETFYRRIREKFGQLAR